MIETRSGSGSPRSKPWATWIAIIGGSLGLHRFYLHGIRDFFGWLHPLPTLLGLYGVARTRSLGQDDQLAWALMPLLGCTITAAMLAAIVYGLTSDEKWNVRFNSSRPDARSGWIPVLGAMVALLVGASVLITTIAYASQRYFESQLEIQTALHDTAVTHASTQRVTLRPGVHPIKPS